MAEDVDITKIQKAFKESLEHLKDDVTEASRGLKPEWRKMLGNMKDFNAPLAKSIAEIRQTSKDTFAGMMGARKFKGITKELKKFADNAGDINPDELKKLKNFTDDIDDFDLTEFQNAQTIVNGIVEENKKLADGQKQSIEKALAGDRELARLKEEAKYFEEEIIEAGNAQNREQMDTFSELKLVNLLEQQELEEELTDAVKETVIKKKKLNLDSIKDETELRDKYNELLKKPLEDAAEGGDIMTKTFDGIKHLTGGLLDIGGFMDDAVKGYQAVTDVATGIQKGANKAFKWLGMIFQGAWLKTIKDWFKKTIVYTKLMKVVNKIRAFSFKGWIASQWTNLKQWVLESKMMGAFNKLRAFSFKAWIATQWANLKQTRLFTALQSILNKATWATFAAWIATKWMEVSLMIKQTAARIAVIAVEIVAWAARMIAKAIEIATMLLPVLPIIAIAAAVLALAALLIWGGMKLYEESDVFKGYIDTAMWYFKEIGRIVGNIFGGFYDFFAGLFTGDWDRMFGGLTDIFGGLWDMFLLPFRTLAKFLKDTFGIDIGGWLTDKLREWLPGWALNLLGMGGTEDTDAMQAGLVGEVEKADKAAGLKSAAESGLMVDDWGQNEVDRSKIAGATDQELKAIIADNDISDEDRSIILDTLNQRQIETGGPDVSAQIAAAREEGLSGADLAERTAQIRAGEYVAGETNNVNATNVVKGGDTKNELVISKNPLETDATLGRLNPIPVTP